MDSAVRHFEQAGLIQISTAALWTAWRRGARAHQPPSCGHRTPCLIAMDEAALFLPQRRGETFSMEIYRDMADAFHQVATMGRKTYLYP